MRKYEILLVPRAHVCLCALTCLGLIPASSGMAMVNGKDISKGEWHLKDLGDDSGVAFRARFGPSGCVIASRKYCVPLQAAPKRATRNQVVMTYLGGPSSDMKKIREDLGVCPQHDVLFADLTVKEHLELFASFKGVPPDQISAAAEEMIVEVGLTEKRNVYAKSLSGGMKRKLSVGIAFIGGSRVVFLDGEGHGHEHQYSMYLVVQDGCPEPGFCIWQSPPAGWTPTLAGSPGT
jgi:energy-coupling factor transporter ATP-binding protein EcfA2